MTEGERSKALNVSNVLAPIRKSARLRCPVAMGKRASLFGWLTLKGNPSQKLEQWAPLGNWEDPSQESGNRCDRSVLHGEALGVAAPRRTTLDAKGRAHGGLADVCEHLADEIREKKCNLKIGPQCCMSFWVPCQTTSPKRTKKAGGGQCLVLWVFCAPIRSEVGNNV